MDESYFIWLNLIKCVLDCLHCSIIVDVCDGHLLWSFDVEKLSDIYNASHFIYNYVYLKEQLVLFSGHWLRLPECRNCTSCGRCTYMSAGPVPHSAPNGCAHW